MCPQNVVQNLNNNESKLGVPSAQSYCRAIKMKKSKKAGGFNLRKSLAWDRAFFTEEGVLNDSELSIISGCDRENLSVIDEQAGDLLPGQSDTNLEEDLSKKSPPGYPSRRNVTNSSSIKQGSKTGSSLASVSRSAQKVSPGHGLKKNVCKEVRSPIASASQKRRNSTRKILTRNSKIQVQISKKNPAVQSIQSAAGGSSLKSNVIPQPVARKSLSSKLSSNLRHTSSAAKASLESIPNSIKPSANVEDDATNSTLRMHSLMSLKTPHTTKQSKPQEHNSSQDLLTAAADVVKYTEGRSSTAALSHVYTDNAGLNRKNTQVQGNKPSGLRMPSPSLRFFSETKSFVSNRSSQTNSMPPKVLKSSIPSSRTPKFANHTHVCEPAQLLQRALNVDTTGNTELCSQRTSKCSASTIIPKVHAKVMRDKFNEQEVELRVPLVHDNSNPTSHGQFRYSNLDGFGQYIDQVPTSLNVEDQNSKDNKSTFSHPEFDKDLFKATILFQKNRTSDGSCESCPGVQLAEASEINRQSQNSQLSEGVEFNSSVTENDDILESKVYLTSHQNLLMLASDVGSTTSIVDDNKTCGESTSCNLDQDNTKRSMGVQLDERNLFADEKSNGKLEEANNEVPGCIGGFMAVQEKKISDEVAGICSENCSVSGRSKCQHAEDEQGDMMSDSKLSNVKLYESSETQHEAIDDTWKRNSTNFHYCDSKDICNLSLEIGALSSHCASNLPKLSNEDPIEPYHLCKLDEVKEPYLFSRLEIVDNYASTGDASIAYEQCSAITEDSCTELERQQILNNEAIAQEETNARGFDDMNEASNSVEVKDQADLDLPNCDDGSTHQSTHLEFHSSGMRSKDQAVIAVAEPDTEENWSELDIVNKNVVPCSYELVGATLEEYNESDKPECNLAPSETDDNTYDTGVHDKDSITKQRKDDQKLTRPPSNAVPFSDEWLAAIESAGEDILTLKTGAVKHSPPDKSIPEPSPWSPVKRKANQVVGPFDCTKYTNA